MNEERPDDLSRIGAVFGVLLTTQHKNMRTGTCTMALTFLVTLAWSQCRDGWSVSAIYVLWWIWLTVSSRSLGEELADQDLPTLSTVECSEWMQMDAISSFFANHNLTKDLAFGPGQRAGFAFYCISLNYYRHLWVPCCRGYTYCCRGN